MDHLRDRHQVPDDQFLNGSIDAAHAALVVLVPGNFLADTVPIHACLRAQIAMGCLMNDEPLAVRYIPGWFPGAKFKRLAKETCEKFRTAVDGHLEYVKNAMKVRRLHNNPGSNSVFNATASPERGFRGP